MKSKKLLGIFAVAFLLAGCSAQDADLSEETPQDAAEVYSVVEETSSQATEETDTTETIEEFEIIDIIWGEKYYVALCGDGSVRQWSVSEEKEDAVIVGGIHNAVRIMSMGAGRVFYALTEDGALYMWGENEYVDTNTPKWGEERQKIYEDRAVSVLPAGEFVLADATDKQAFAIDKEGNLYTWGDTGYRYFYSSDEELDHEYHLENSLVKGTERIFTGTDLSHYFIREDGSVYTLRSWHSSYDYIPWIYPGIGRTNTMLLDGIDFIVFGWGGSSSLYLYELGETDIGQIAADKYTVFLYGEDGVLRYWDSCRVKYHDCVEAVYRASGPRGPWLDVNGDYVEVDINEILGRPEGDTGRIVDMCACDENVLFLMETGKVFMSSYQAYDQEEVEYWIHSTNPYRTEYTRMVELELKKVVFVPLEWENIVKLNSDGDSRFTAVDSDGNYYVLDTGTLIQ